MLHPVLLDRQPPYLDRRHADASLLLAPIGSERLLSLLCAHLGAAGRRPLVLTSGVPTAAYEQAIRRVRPVERVAAVSDFRHSEWYEPSDWLLFVDARWYTSDHTEIAALLKDVSRSNGHSTHLTRPPRHRGGTTERVETGDDGSVQRIRRYYDQTTWPYLSGVIASLVPAGCLRALPDPLPLGSLTELRRALVVHDVPCRDIAAEAPAFDFESARDFLLANEQAVLARAGAALPLTEDRAARLDADIRLVGPVIVHRGASVQRGAVVIGPSVIGEAAVVGSGALVAQCVVWHDTVVPPGARIRHQVIPAAPDSGAVDLSMSADGELVPMRAQPRPRSSSYPSLKAAIDAVVAFVALLVLSPLLLAIALVIAFDSRGSVLFADMREGRAGRLFRCLKFRTMVHDGAARQREMQARNEVDGPQFKLEKDPRVTRVGRWLRPMSLDELPQLVNVLRGEMSLIGPRPSPFRENQLCVPWRRGRLSVRPGITGLWQICRHDRRHGDFHQWIYMDLLYVRHMSLWVDFKIALATVLTLGGKTHVPVHWIVPAARQQP